MLHLRRDPRDLALSLSMAAIRPTGALGWVGSLDHIHAVVSTHLELDSLALERLQLNHRVICYETLVAQPEASLRGCLDAMQLPMHEDVLHPERNPRIPITLSHSQAREPIYSTSVGRWRHYAWLFGDEWEQLASLFLPDLRPQRRQPGGDQGCCSLCSRPLRNWQIRASRRSLLAGSGVSSGE